MVKIDWRGDQVKGQVSKGIKLALYGAAGEIKQDSVREVPWETRDLQRNCQIDDAEIEEGIIKVGYDLPYALIQHENLDFNHPRGGKAKYLEDPFNAKKESYRQKIAEAVRSELR